MAVVVVQVGQCGNQLGDELFTQLSIATGSSPAGSSPYFTRDGKARCILVDSEPKVVQGVQARHASIIRPENVVHGQSGRGNNWGLGYYGVNDPQSLRHDQNNIADRAFRNMYKQQREEDDCVLSKALCAIHMETRRTSECANFEAIILLHSLAGGTGSGMASRLAEKIRLYFIEPPEGAVVDELYEDKMARKDGLDSMMVEKRRARYLISIAVAPQSAGEMATQGINAALTLHVLHKHTNAIILLRNDDALSPGESHSSSATKGKHSILQRCVTFKEANEVFVAMLLPVLHYGVGPEAAQCLGALVRQCVPVKNAQKLTGDNTILTLLPTPQQTYERFRGSALRCRFFAIHGSKVMMPGCRPELPQEVVMARSAWLRCGGNNNNNNADEYDSQVRLSENVRGNVEGRRPGNKKKKPFEPMSRSRWSESDDEEDESNMDYVEVGVTTPKELLQHYAKLRRSPVASMSTSMEGIAVLNQARELNASLLFPLLRSAAVKVKVGAFLFTYADVGVSTQRIEKAYHYVAEFLANAEEI